MTSFNPWDNWKFEPFLVNQERASWNLLWKENNPYYLRFIRGHGKPRSESSLIYGGRNMWAFDTDGDGSVGWLIRTRFLNLRWTYRSLYLPVDTMLVSWQTIKPFRVNSPTSKPKLLKSLMKKNSDHHRSRPWWLLPLVQMVVALVQMWLFSFWFKSSLILGYLSQCFYCWQICYICCVKFWLARH